MGGKNAVIVMPDADLDKAATAIHGGAFGSTGQRCTATSRVIAHPDIKKALVDRLVAAAEKIKLGPGLDHATGHGAIGRRTQWQTVMDYIKVGQGEGARMITGGSRPESLSKGYFIEPTIFDGVSPSMRIFKEEIFGPVLSVATASSLDEALKFANSVEYGLTTSIFTSDITSVMKFVEDVEVGMVHVNEPTVGWRSTAAVRRHEVDRCRRARDGGEGLNFFTELKTGVHQLFRKRRTIDDTVGLGPWRPGSWIRGPGTRHTQSRGSPNRRSVFDDVPRDRAKAQLPLFSDQQTAAA
jgi:aldehyde dehydrogenase (NAD+)